MQPVVDPADWCAQSLGPVDDWAYRLTDRDQDELLAAVDHFRKLRLPLPATNFSAIGAGSTIEKVLRLPGVPPLTPEQQEAIALYRSIVEEFAVDMEFKAGDIQFLANQVTLHSRRAFEDWPEPHRRRHLLRLWLRDPAGRPIPKEQRGTRRDKGVQIEGLQMVAPLEVEVAAV